jgi:hypothetical protein
MTGWLNENGGADRCAMTPSGLREMQRPDLDRLSRRNASQSLVAQWCAGYKAGTAEGLFSC